jgi:hypothetical protein
MSLDDILSTIHDLEEAIQSRQSEAMRSAYRQKLCSLLSQFLLKQPYQLSVDKDITGTLWRTCFYNRIGEIRERIAKEIRKLKRLAQQAAADKDGNASGTKRQLVDPTTGKKQKPNTKVSSASTQEVDKIKLEELQTMFKTFLGEAVAMYDFLVDKFQAALKEQLQRSNEKVRLKNALPQSVQEGNSTHGEQPANADNPIVHILYSLLIHRGDLHRYASDHNKAETSYNAAIALRPGMGNPYNQMAVISQIKDQACLALYYYTRSLYATQESFATSKANLRRLFQSNSDWLKNHGGNDSRSLTILNEGIGKLNKDKKTGAVKLFLAEYVGLHGLFATFAPPAADADASGATTTGREVDLESKMNAIIESSDLVLKHLQYLLTEQCLGDALILKMGVINIFTVKNLYDLIIADKKSKDSEIAAENVQLPNELEYIACLPSVALNFSYRFGMVLVHQFKLTLQHSQTIESCNNGKDAVSVASGGERSNDGSRKENSNKMNNRQLRLLSCLGLFCDWLRLENMERVLTNQERSVKVSERAAAVASNGQDAFYAKLAELWNEIVSAKEYATLVEDNGQVKQFAKQQHSQQHSLKEHFFLRGFAPLTSFVSQNDDHVWEHVPNNNEAALRLARIYQVVVLKCAKDRTGVYHLAADVKDPVPEEVEDNSKRNCIETQNDDEGDAIVCQAVPPCLYNKENDNRKNAFQSTSTTTAAFQPPPGFMSSGSSAPVFGGGKHGSSSTPPGFNDAPVEQVVVTSNPFVNDGTDKHANGAGLLGMNAKDNIVASSSPAFGFSSFLSSTKQNPSAENNSTKLESTLDSLLWGDVGTSDINLGAASGQQTSGMNNPTLNSNPWDSASGDMIAFDPMNVDIQASTFLGGLHFPNSAREHSRLPAANESVKSRNPFLT